MNSSSSHPKVKLSLSLSDPVYVAGTSVSGKLQMECKAESGLGIGTMMVELFAIQGTLETSLYLQWVLTRHRTNIERSFCDINIPA